MFDCGNLVEKLHLRTTFLHLGLILICAAYIVAGAMLFQYIERPFELQTRREALIKFEQLKQNLIANLSTASASSAETLLDSYVQNLLELFEDPYYGHIFESHYTTYGTEADQWTFPAAVLFTTTTVIPIGYGYICPMTELGKALLIVYGIFGIPLVLVTMADTGKFVSQFVITFFNESMSIPTAIFVSLLALYPCAGGILFCLTSNMTFLDATYFSLTSIFTIGFGDLTPQTNVLFLVFFNVIGVILVTITIDFAAAELIDRVHYMGRHVGKAKEIAGKMFQMAQSLHMNKGISGLTAGMSQLNALARLGLLGKVDREALSKGPIAFAPVLDDADFMDTTSLYPPKIDEEDEQETWLI